MSEAQKDGRQGFTDEELDASLDQLKRHLRALSEENQTLVGAGVDAADALSALEERRARMEKLNKRLAMVSANSAELLAELEEKNEALQAANRELARANVHAAELMGELELRNNDIARLNAALARANADASEVVAELEFRKEQLEHLNATLVSTNEEKTHLLGVAAHDLRGGISGMVGLSDLAVELLRDNFPKELVEYVHLIRKESRRLLQLLGSLLDVSRVEQGRVELDCARVDLESVVREAVTYHQKFADAKRQRLELQCPACPFWIFADTLRIRQVLDNLISNAIKYSPYSGTICVRMWQNKKDVCVCVDDEGPGLTEEDLTKAFRVFQRLSAKPTGGEDSHGLGLAIAQKMIGLHHGRIWVENRQEGNGARFGFSLPVAEEDSAAFSGPRRRILVVDDSALNQTLMRKFLRGGGHDVECADSGDAALLHLETTDYDVVFMDVEMPGRDGFETARAIRASETDGRRLPIVAMTAHTDEEHKRTARDAGMDDYVTKPICREQVLLTVARIGGQGEIERGDSPAG